MDKYCRTCMRDSIKYSPIFEEMTYGGISLQEAIEDVCHLEVTIDDNLPLYVCRDCALKLYDIVKFKMEAHEVYSALRKLMAIYPPIKMEIEEYIDESSLLSPETENIKVEEFSVSHSNEGSFNTVNDPFGNTTNSDAGNANFEPTQSRVNVGNSNGEFDSFEGSYNTATDLFGNTTISNAGNANFEPTQSSDNVGNSVVGMYSFENEMPRLKLEDSDGAEEIFERIDNKENFDDKLKFDNKERNLRCVSHKQVNIDRGDMENKYAGIYGDNPELPSILAVESGTLEFDESMENGNRREEIFQKNTKRIAEGKGNLCSQTLHPNGKEFDCDGIQIEDRKRDSKDVTSTSYYHRVFLLEENREDKILRRYNPTSREKNCYSDGTHLQPERIGDNESIESRSVDSNSIVNERGGVHEDASSNLTETTAASVGLGTSVSTGVCHVCDERFCKKSDLEKHERIHLVEKQFECEVCSRKFRMDYTFKRHQKIHELCKKSLRSDDRNEIGSELLKLESTKELDKLPIKVYIIERESIGRNATVLLDSNAPLNEGENIDYPKSFMCDRCRKEFRNKEDILQHLIQRCGRRSSSKCLSPVVSKKEKKVHGSNVFNRNMEERGLLRRKSNGKILVVDSELTIPETAGESKSAEKPFACQYCSKVFRSSSGRNMHQRIHTREKPLACQYCSRMFVRSSDRKNHERIHTGEKPFACKYCSMMFRSISNRNQHELTHTGEKPFACKYCAKIFGRKLDRKNHELIHTGEKPFSCQYCSKVFSSSSNRIRHELIHTGEKPFACNYCANMFGRKHDLNNHERIHSGEKPFSCKYCSKMFRTTSHRKKHERIHTGEKPFSSKYCSKTFSQKSNRIRHERIHSGEKPL